MRALGMYEEFVRTREMYFCYSAGTFQEPQIGVTQILLTKPHCRREPILAPVPMAPKGGSRILAACRRVPSATS